MIMFIAGLVVLFTLFAIAFYMWAKGTEHEISKKQAALWSAIGVIVGLGVAFVSDAVAPVKASAADNCSRENPCGSAPDDPKTGTKLFGDGVYKNVGGWEAPNKVQTLAQKWIDNHPKKVASMKAKNGNGVFDWINDKMKASTCLAGPATGYYTDGYCQSWLSRKHPEAQGQDGSTIQELRNIQFKCGGSVVIGAFGGKKWAPIAIGTGYTTCLYNNVWQTK